MPTVIVENDESRWEDATGTLYHFPARYKRLLPPGQSVIYYKGNMKNRRFKDARLLPTAHYFATAQIDKVYPDTASTKGDLFATINEYRPFKDAVPLRDNSGASFEEIPASQQKNYWRNGVRPISQSVYDKIVGVASFLPQPPSQSEPPTFNDSQQAFESQIEGTRKEFYTTVYERKPQLRKQAIAIHGATCHGCNFNFASVYGAWGEGFIHIHHTKPLYSLDTPVEVNPATDLVPLCPNCHSMVHRRKNAILTLDELREMIATATNVASLSGHCVQN